jgi:hypothetical protein
MSSQYYRLDEHKIEASHIRGFPRATSTHENEVLHLAIKQYTPLNNPNPQDGDITIIAAHANAFPKVCRFIPPPQKCCDYDVLSLVVNNVFMLYL